MGSLSPYSRCFQVFLLPTLRGFLFLAIGFFIPILGFFPLRKASAVVFMRDNKIIHGNGMCGHLLLISEVRK